MKKITMATILVAVLGAAGLVSLYITHREADGRKGEKTIPLSKDIRSYVRLQQPRMLTYDELGGSWNE